MTYYKYRKYYQEVTNYNIKSWMTKWIIKDVIKRLFCNQIILYIEKKFLIFDIEEKKSSLFKNITIRKRKRDLKNAFNKSIIDIVNSKWSRKWEKWSVLNPGRMHWSHPAVIKKRINRDCCSG